MRRVYPSFLFIIVMNKAWFFGDSFTYGDGCRPTDKYFKEFPEQRGKLWTTLISSHLGLEENNLGKSGSSIPLIINDIITKLPYISTGDFVCMSDTIITRFIEALPEERRVRSVPGELLFRENKPESVKNIREVGDYIVNCIRPYESIWVEYYHNQYKSFERYFIKNNISVVFWTWDKWYSFENITKATESKIVDGHWSFQGHQQMYEYIRKVLDSGNLI